VIIVAEMHPEKKSRKKAPISYHERPKTRRKETIKKVRPQGADERRGFSVQKSKGKNKNCGIA